MEQRLRSMCGMYDMQLFTVLLFYATFVGVLRCAVDSISIADIAATETWTDSHCGSPAVPFCRRVRKWKTRVAPSDFLRTSPRLIRIQYRYQHSFLIVFTASANDASPISMFDACLCGQPPWLLLCRTY